MILGDSAGVAKIIPYVDHKRTHFRKLALKALETASQKNHGGPFEDAAACTKAAQAWTEWWKANQAKLTWDAHKRVFA